MPATASPCGLLSALSNHQLQLMDRLNNKMTALQRVAHLIEQAADPRSLVPAIDSLVPLSSLDLKAYNQLRAACPGLGLPNTAAGLAQLQGELLSAYANLVNKLDLHPFKKLKKLQQLLDRQKGKLHANLDKLNGYLACAAGACRAVAAVPSGLANNDAALNTYTQNFVTNSGNVLDSAGENKTRQLNALKDGIQGISK